MNFPFLIRLDGLVWIRLLRQSIILSRDAQGFIHQIPTDPILPPMCLLTCDGAKRKEIGDFFNMFSISKGTCNNY